MMSARVSSLQRRLQLLIGLGIGCVVLSMGMVWLIYNATTSRDAAERHLLSQVDMLAAIVRPAISFSDSVMAGEMMATFRHDPEIVGIALFAADKSLFSSYRAADRQVSEPVYRAEGSYAESGHLLVYHAIRLKGDMLGMAMIESDLRGLHEQTLAGSIVVGLAMLLSMLLAYLISLRLQRQIAAPIIRLAGLMRRLGVEQDYSLRAGGGGEYREIADLNDGFDAMTERIERSFELIEEQSRALVERERHFRLLVEAIPLPVGVSRASDGHLLYVNDEALRFFRFTGAAPESLSCLLNQTPGDHARLQDELAGRDSLSDREVTVRRQDGSPVIMALSTQPVEFSGEEAQLNVLFDISERKLIQEALARNNEELEERVAIRTEQLCQAKEEADRANRDKSRFLASASHDLRQPLQALTLFLSSLGLALTTDRQRELHGLAQKSSRALGDLLGALLDVSRLASGSLQADMATIRLAPLLLDLADEWEPVARARGLDFRLGPCPKVCVQSDPVLLMRLLRNLLSNAIRYTEKGGVLLGCRYHDGMLRICVWDTGPGIPESEVQNIFEEFYQIGNPERDRDKGLGLGLSIVRGLAGLLGHRIHVHSRPGRGSCFALEVDVVEMPAGHGAQPESPPISLSGCRALLIDDDAHLLRAMQAGLLDRHCDCILAADCDEALAKVEADGVFPHFIIADYRLREGRTGIEAVQRIRALAGSHIPAIIVTGDTAAGIGAQAVRSDCLLLHKPVSVEALLQHLGAMFRPGREPAP